MKDDLTNKRCRTCELGDGKLQPEEIAAFITHTPLWQTTNNHEISRAFTFPDFKTALAFVDKIGALSEAQGHHPEIAFGWGYVRVTLFTHAVNGLSENDFIMAAKIDKLI
jgi:4a-hydroxytetrahydrobiopterin dehydratase